LQRRGVLFSFLVLFLVLFISGCSDLQDTINDVEGTVSQSKEDVEFLAWMKGSVDTINSDYRDIKQAFETQDSKALEQAAANLTAHSIESKKNLASFNPSPKVQPAAQRYGQLLNQSYTLGIILEENAQTLDITKETTLQEVEENMARVNYAYIFNMMNSSSFEGLDNMKEGYTVMQNADTANYTNGSMPASLDDVIDMAENPDSLGMDN